MWVLLPICIHYRLFKVGSNQISVKALLQGKASIAILVSCNFLYHDKSSSMFHADFFLQIVPAKMEKPDNEDIIIQIEETLCSFDQITSLLFPPFQSCFADHVFLFADDVVTSWPQTKISDWSDIKCIVIVAVHNRTCSIPKCVSCNF